MSPMSREYLLLDSSYPILWRSDQRERNRRDPPLLTRRFTRSSDGYGLSSPGSNEKVSIFAERERHNPGMGGCVCRRAITECSST